MKSTTWPPGSVLSGVKWIIYKYFLSNPKSLYLELKLAVAPKIQSLAASRHGFFLVTLKKNWKKLLVHDVPWCPCGSFQITHYLMVLIF